MNEFINESTCFVLANEWINEQTDGRMNEGIKEWMDKWMNVPMHVSFESADEWMNGSMNLPALS